MIKIAVCDDEQHFVTQIKNILVEYGKTNQTDISVSEFHDGVMLLDRYDCSYDIIFLDIKMPHIDGVKVAEKIRVRDPNVTIIFLTSLLQRAVDGYRVRAYDFLIKPISEKKLTKEIDRWIETNREKKQECLLVENMTGRFMIPISSLRYIETADRNLLLHSEDKNIVCHKKLKVLKERLEPYGFGQSHKSYLVNFSYIDTISGNAIILVTKEEIPLSRAMKKEFMTRLARYMGGKL